jgi:PhnB protein
MAEPFTTLAAAKISPFLSLRRGREAMAFYKAAFGARELFRFDGDNGTVVARLAVGQADFWLSDESPEHKNFSPETLGGSTMHIVIVVDDPDAVFNHAIASGATVERPMQDEPYGWRIGKIRDPFGHAWEIGRELP